MDITSGKRDNGNHQMEEEKDEAEEMNTSRYSAGATGNRLSHLPGQLSSD